MEIGFQHSRADHSLFLFKTNTIYIATLIYVDDIILLDNNDDHIAKIKVFLHNKLSIKDLGPLILPWHRSHSYRRWYGFESTERKYTLDILADSGLDGCRPSHFPMETNIKLDHAVDYPLVDEGQYRRLIERLFYLQVTRPDITLAVNTLIQFVSSPRQPHLSAVHKVLR